jgi:predicted metal-dependent hydrolase
MPLAEAPPTGHLPFEPPPTSPPDLVEFWSLWREEKFWACHEALEEVWHHESGDRRLFLNGLIHGAVAVFQHRRGNAVGAARQLLRARIKLAGHRPAYEGLDLEAFLAGIEAEIAPSLAQLNERQRESLRELEARLRLQYIKAPEKAD